MPLPDFKEESCSEKDGIILYLPSDFRMDAVQPGKISRKDGKVVREAAYEVLFEMNFLPLLSNQNYSSGRSAAR